MMKWQEKLRNLSALSVGGKESGTKKQKEQKKEICSNDKNL